ncbi:MAG: ferrous iron transport protein B [Ignavibacteriae bacterium]|nr:ferrous iron transport protein B [Ignavibacteriota bacterium]
MSLTAQQVESTQYIALRNIAIIGNPNAGKTTLFNALTGLRQKVANYPGVTVEKKSGTLSLPDETEAVLLDLPGTYSLTANSPDEKIATDVLLQKIEGIVSPSLIICVVDASNVERNLYLVTQIIDYGFPIVIALNMMDVAEKQGISIDVNKLSSALGVPVIPTVASKGIGLNELKNVVIRKIEVSLKVRQWKLPQVVREECDELKELLQQKHHFHDALAFHEAITLLTSPEALHEHEDRFDPEIIEHVKGDYKKLGGLGFDTQLVFVESRYELIQRICNEAVKRNAQTPQRLSDKIDKILTHNVWGFLFFLLVMLLMFQTIFSWASYPMDWISSGVDGIGAMITNIIPPGDLQDLLVNGAVAGVGAVVTFLPQIALLFLFIGFLEDTGYMARAAFVMDRMMGKVGLHGKSFIPLLSSFACAIPGIMATRTIENKNDRLATMLVAPLMSCSARLPVYTLLIAAFIPKQTVLGIFSLPGLTLVSMYLLGVVMALSVAWLFKKTLLKGKSSPFIMELPPYKVPSLKNILIQMWERAWHFLQRAGTIILGVSIILWFLATYPKTEYGTPTERLEKSFAGQAGHLIEPLIKPLGFDWKIGVGIVTSLLQREVFVSTMGTLYNVNTSDDSETVSLQTRMQNDTNPETGLPTFTALTAICVMVYYVLAMQCFSTIAVVRRESGSWKWATLQFGYMTALAYVVTFIVYRIGLLING